jgi:hypothetical protein
MYVASLLLAPTEGGMREWGTIEDAEENCCSLLCCLVTKIHGTVSVCIQRRATRHTKKSSKNDCQMD